ncbi:MAG: response regulator [Gammaproteobacteria bacterium]|nr:response regulator [Gammaproteobacteria bacterium]
MGLACAALLYAAAASAAPIEHDVAFDVDGRWTLTDALASTAWRHDSSTPNFGYYGGAVWLRTTVTPGAELVQIDNPWPDNLDVYFLREGQLLESVSTGDAHPFSSRPLAEPGFLFHIPPQADTLMIRSQGRSAHYLPVRLTTKAEYDQFRSRAALLEGGYYGIILIMLLYNLILYIGIRDSLYLYYVLYAASLSLVMLGADGLGAQYLWPDTPAMQQFSSHAMVAVTLTFAVLFAHAFLRISIAGRLPNIAVRAYLVAVALNAVWGIASNSHTSSIASAVLVMLGTSMLLGIAFMRLRAGYRPALIYLVADGALLLGATAFSALQMGWLQDGLLVRYGLHLGSTAQLALLALALSQRINSERAQRIEVQHQSLELAREVRALRTETQIAEEHRQLQRSLQHAQKLKTIGELTGGFAHDFNNILASVLGFAELARQRVREGSDARLLGFITEIESAGKRGADLVRQLLIYSRGTPSEPRETDLRETLQETARLLRGTLPSTVRVGIDVPAAAVRLVVDTNQIQQMVVNLALNGAEAMESRGELNLELDVVTVEASMCSSCAVKFSGEHVVIRVADRGRGITGNVQDLFTPFHTTKPVGKGSGLGLSVVHGIAHEHHGHVKLKARPDGGTTVGVYLPLKGEPAAARSVEDAHILVIDDDEAVGRYLGSLLEEHGYRVSISNRSSEALQQVMRDPFAYDLVVTDQLMPRITGVELARDLRDLRPDLPVFLCTGNPDSIDRGALLETSIRAVFGKPIEADLLLAKIAGQLRSAAR